MGMYQKYFKKLNVAKSTGVKFYQYKFPKVKRHILVIKEHSYIGRVLALTLYNPRWAIDWKYTLAIAGTDRISSPISPEFANAIKDSLSECNAVFICTDTAIPPNCADILKSAKADRVPIFVFTRTGIRIPENLTPTQVFRYATDLQLSEQLLFAIQSLKPHALRKVLPKGHRFMGLQEFRCNLEEYDTYMESYLKHLESKFPEKENPWQNVCVD